MCNCLKSVCSSCLNFCCCCATCTIKSICMCVIMPLLFLAIIAAGIFLLYTYIATPDKFHDMFSYLDGKFNDPPASLFGTN